MNVVSIRRGEEELRQAPEAPMEEEGAQLKRLYGIFRRRWRLALGAGLVVLAAVVAYTLMSPRIFTATTLIMVNPGREQVISQDQMIDNSAPSSAAVDSEIEVLRSPMLSLRLVDDMNLVEDAEWNSALRPPGPLAMALAPLAALSQTEPEADAADTQRERVARALNRAISVRRRGLSYGIEVSLDARSPRRAAELVNRFADLYLQAQTEARFDASQRANSWLSQRLDELRREVQTKERAADSFRIENGLSIAAGGADANLPPQSTEVQTMLVQARADLAEKEARLRQVQQLVREGGSVESIGTALNSPVITGLRNREAELGQNLAELRRRYSAEHPDVLAAQTELAQLRERISEEVGRITASLQNDVDVARARLGTLQGSFGGTVGARGENNEAIIRYRELLREASAARAVHETFLQRFHEVSDQGNLPTAISRIVSRASPPGAPSKPNLTSSLLMAILLAGLAGAGLAFLLETLDASLSSAEDAERKLGLPAVASIPVLRARDMASVPAHRRSPPEYLVDKPASGFAEAFRVLRTSLMHARVDRKLRVLAVTSAVPDEGKTTTSLCLARIAAMSGQSVVIVDCDLRRHSLSGFVGARPRIGLMDVLMGEADWRSAVVQDSESSAHVLPTIISGFNPRDVFDSAAMQRLMEELRATYDLVILDSAPVLSIAETRTVATHADLTLIVVRSDKTPAGAVRTAVREIMHAGADVGGVALNYVDPKRPGRGTYGDSLYYSYGRGYYQS